MSFATFINLVTIILCAAVLVQSVRMMRSLAALKTADLPSTVQALDSATAQARYVLVELKETLRTDGNHTLKALQEASQIRDELELMVGIADASAERLLQTSSASKPTRIGDETQEMAA